MYKRTILLLVLLIANYHSMHSQKVEKLKKSGKKYIVNQAIEFLNEQGVNTSEIRKKKVRVVDDSDFVFVYFNMGFKYEAEEKLYQNYTIYIGFSDNGTQANFDDYDPGNRKYKLTADDEAKIRLALGTEDYSVMVESGNSYQIKEEPGYFEVTYQSDDSAWCYQIDKKTKEIKELWHEHLVPPPFEDVKEIKE